MIKLCPSILSADFNRMGEQLKILENAGVEILHIDVMDGMFVPSISFGMPVIRSIRKECGMFFDVHLMIEDPERYISEFVSCGADSITIHVEACKDPEKCIDLIHEAGVKAGISIKPNTPVEAVAELLPKVEMVLVMTVEPGFGGQKYIEACTEKVRTVRALLREKGIHAEVQVDGGINAATIETAVRAGANYLVAGSYIFHGDLAANVKDFNGIIERIGEKDS